ncbi:glycosyltransferase [Amycolatopsis thermoflava]|uniref:glycosyltransferase n=1 Tax=Amycolatopsis thermoflava TaxID=84480 RepID=UPI003EC0FB6F
MRVLMTCQPFYSHLVPVLVPAAKALQRAGHEVAVATAPAMAPHLARAGIEHLPLPNVLTLTELVADPAAVPEGDVREASSTLTIAFAGSLAGAFARDVLAVAGSWKPEVLVRECKEFGGYLAAERLGLPQAVLDTSPFSALNLPLVRDALNGQRAEFGLDTVDEPGHPEGFLLAGVVPAAWYPEELWVSSARYYRPDPPAGPLDVSLLDLPDDRPLVVAGLGSVARTFVPETPAVLETMVAALGDLPCTAVVALGADPGEWTGPRPGNVRLMSFVPQPLLLESADLLVTHGGFGSVAEAIRTGTPMVLLPMFSDQSHNAARTAALGLGIRLDVGSLTPASLTESCEQALRAPYPHRAAAMARQSRACPGFDQFAEDVAALV